jgi:hypothetical protein
MLTIVARCEPILLYCGRGSSKNIDRLRRQDQPSNVFNWRDRSQVQRCPIDASIILNDQ